MWKKQQDTLPSTQYFSWVLPELVSSQKFFLCHLLHNCIKAKSPTAAVKQFLKITSTDGFPILKYSNIRSSLFTLDKLDTLSDHDLASYKPVPARTLLKLKKKKKKMKKKKTWTT